MSNLELVADPWMTDLVPAVKNFLISLSPESERSVPTTVSKMISPVASVDAQHNVESTLPIDKQIENTANRLSNCSLSAPVEFFRCSCDLPILSVAFEGELKVPAPSPAFLQLSYGSNDFDIASLPPQNGCEFPSQGSKILEVSLVEKNCLTKSAAKKQKYEIWTEFGDEDVEYKPGDAFYFLCPNSDEEVNHLLSVLNLEEKANFEAKLSILDETTKRNPCVPAFLSNPGSLRHWFKTCLDFRKPISKTLLRVLADFCSDEVEKRKILALCSTTNTQLYVQKVLQAKLSLLDILHSFVSCKPPVERLIENLPRLAARPYSVASFQPKTKKIRFVFSLVEIPAGEGRFYNRSGLATGFLTKVQLKQKISIFLKKTTNFHLPSFSNSEIDLKNSQIDLKNSQIDLKNSEIPLIMIGPGTGVAPFLSFLDEIQNLNSKGFKFDERWLFFGCRNKNLDFIYKTELENFCSAKILTKFLVSFSEDNKEGNEGKGPVYEENKEGNEGKMVKEGKGPVSEDEKEGKEGKGPRYVQDLLRLHSKEIADLLKKNAIVFVCGDAQGMAVDVHKTFLEILKSEEKINDAEALNYLEKMRSDLRYLQDIWT